MKIECDILFLIIKCVLGWGDPDLIEAISKKGFWFKIAAGLSFPAMRDDPPDHILFVGLTTEEYISISGT